MDGLNKWEWKSVNVSGPEWIMTCPTHISICTSLFCPYIIMYYGGRTQSRLLFSALLWLFFSWTIEKARHYFLFVFQTTWQTSWNGIILFGDGLNIGAHLPCAVKEALAAAAAFSRTIWIKPKSRGALPVCLAFPTVITAKKRKPRHFIKW